MNSRERVIASINFIEPDRVPIDMVLTIDAYRNMKRFLKLDSYSDMPKMGHWTNVQMPLEMILKLGIDIYHISSNSAESGHSKKLIDGSFVDEWGCYWKKNNLGNGLFNFELQNPPLADAEIGDLEKYEWPDPNDPIRFKNLEEELRNVRETTDLAICAKFAGAVFELATYMRGHENWYCDILVNQEFAHALMDKISQIQKKINERCMEQVGKYIDILRLSGEDLGMQDRPLFSLSTFRNVIKPHLSELWSHAKTTLHQYNDKAKIMLHSCGDIHQFINDLIECGIDILDPVQPAALEMERLKLKKEFGDKIVFHGNIDIQKVLPFGTKEEIVEEVKASIKALAPGGGFILSPAHNVQGDVSAENLITMIEATKKYGTYPIKI